MKGVGSSTVCCACVPICDVDLPRDLVKDAHFLGHFVRREPGTCKSDEMQKRRNVVFTSGVSSARVIWSRAGASKLKWANSD